MKLSKITDSTTQLLQPIRWLNREVQLDSTPKVSLQYLQPHLLFNSRFTGKVLESYPPIMISAT